jgi:N utilization substance protein B
MSGRHEARTLAVQFLFQRDFNSGDLPEALADFWPEHKAGPKVQKFAEELILGVERERTEIDRQLAKFAENWEIKRMGAVDRNVMRLALYEMNFCPDIPPVVSINEAIDLAKELSSDESGKFVNGILDRARKELDRPARAAVLRPAPRKKS